MQAPANHLLTPLTANKPEPMNMPNAYPKMKYAKGAPWREKAVMNAEQEAVLGPDWYDTPTLLSKALLALEAAGKEALALGEKALASAKAAEADLKAELAKSEAPKPKLQAATPSTQLNTPPATTPLPPANQSPEPAK